MPERILILGGGYAGVEAALTLSKKKKKDDIEITVIDRNDYHTLLTELHEVAGNRISEDGVIIPFDRIFKYTDVKYVTTEITGYDFANKKISSATQDYVYNYLILAMGSTPNYYGISGLKQHAFTLWSYKDAIRIREHVRDCFIKARNEKDPEKIKQLLTFVVAGAGFTGIEMIGELAVWVKKLCREYDVCKDHVRLMVVDLLPRVLNVLKEKNSKKAHDYLVKKLHVEVLLDRTISGVSENGFMAGEQFIPSSTLIWACGVSAVKDVDKLDIVKVASKRLKVDEYCMTEHQGVYAVGDISGFKDDQGTVYPAMVENAIQTAHGAAINILMDIRKKEKKKVEVKMHGVMVCIGNYFAVSELMGKSLPSWLSVVMKFVVNIHYLWEIVGFYGIGNYLYHEILQRKQNKNIIEQHYSTRVQTWWLAPLRIFLGSMWLYEGIKKVIDGWFESPKLDAFFNGATAFYDKALGPAKAVTDAVTEATTQPGTVEQTVKLLFNWDWGWLRFLAVQANEIAFKIDFYPINWMTQNWILASNDTQMFFQWFVVLSEILIGICLIGGAFNFIASGVSIILMVNFLLTTGLYMSQWWMLFAAFAILGGAGRAFGLDHYIMPYLNNYWEKIWKTRKWKPFFKRSLDRYNP
ncbi:MAG: NAD(P)/FAD-dependent oxidoreductase [Saccharofermentanales bacterium]